MLLSHDDGPLQFCTVSGTRGTKCQLRIRRRIRLMTTSAMSSLSGLAGLGLPFRGTNKPHRRNDHPVAACCVESSAWPSLAWLLPSSTASPLDGQTSAATAVTSADLAQQIKPVAFDLAIVRHGVDQLAATIKQLAAKQEDMAQEIATLQATEQDLKEKMSAAAQPRPASTRKTSQSSGQSPPSGAPVRLLDNAAQSTR